MSKEICYVCNKAIKENPLYIGQDKFRHPSKCVPGSEEWMKSPVSKQGVMGKEIRRITSKLRRGN